MLACAPNKNFLAISKPSPLLAPVMIATLFFKTFFLINDTCLDISNIIFQSKLNFEYIQLL